MLLSSLGLDREKGQKQKWFTLPDGRWLDAWVRTDGTYILYIHINRHSGITEKIGPHDPLTAQAILFHLFQVTPGGNNERTDQDQAAS
jgi:hypothetical protein